MNSMTSEFSMSMLNYFKADYGAFSKVTETEAKDGQVTAAGPEKELLKSFLGTELEIKRGNVSQLERKGIDPTFPFKVYPTGEIRKLPLVYPKPDKQELRLYFNVGQFAPKAGMYWCVFVRDSQLWLGAFDESLLALIDSAAFKMPNSTQREEFLEPEFDSFQFELNTLPPKQKTTELMLWGRNPEIARAAIEYNKFECEIFPAYPVFTSKRSNKPYMEAHHLVPMKLQHQFEMSLDVIENICVLNPYSHRMLHHAPVGEIEVHIVALAKKRRHLLQSLDLRVDDVLSLYL